MSINPFISYFGSKWRLAPRYPRPRHGVIVEPFAGGAGYSTRHHHHRVILVEKNPVVAGVWRYLIRASAGEILRLPLVEPGEKVSDKGLAPEPRALVGFWVNQGTTGPCNQLSQWGEKKRDTFWGRAVRARIATQVDKIRHWQIIEGDYTLAPDIEADWFIDPPYEMMGKHYKEGADAIDFAKLGAWCRTRRGQVMVCENEGATWLPFRPFHMARSARPRVGETNDNAVSAEAIWTNDAEEAKASA